MFSAQIWLVKISTRIVKYESPVAKSNPGYILDIWNLVQVYFTHCLQFSLLTPQTSIFGFHNIDNDTVLIPNHILLLLKLHI